MSADAATAEMPGVYRIADEFERELFAWRDLPSRDGAALRACAYALAQKAETLFAPILGEKERLGKCLAKANANTEEFERRYYLESDRVEDLEARALAAEAALAAERERAGQLVRLLDQQMGTPCEQIRYQQDIDNLRAITTEAIDEIESWGAYASEYFRDKHDLTGTVADLRVRAAAIRAQAE